jgi:hypothetical protein
MATSKLDCIHLHVVEIIHGNYITPMVARKLCCIHLYVLQIRLGNYINTPHATRKLGCIHLYVVQIKLENCINTPWHQKCGLHPHVCGTNQTWKLYQHPMATKMWVASNCMWCKLDLKIVSTPYGNKKIGFHPFVCGVNQT